MRVLSGLAVTRQFHRVDAVEVVFVQTVHNALPIRNSIERKEMRIVQPCHVLAVRHAEIVVDMRRHELVTETRHHVFAVVVAHLMASIPAEAAGRRRFEFVHDRLQIFDSFRVFESDDDAVLFARFHKAFEPLQPQGVRRMAVHADDDMRNHDLHADLRAIPHAANQHVRVVFAALPFVLPHQMGLRERRMDGLVDDVVLRHHVRPMLDRAAVPPAREARRVADSADRLDLLID